MFIVVVSSVRLAVVSNRLLILTTSHNHRVIVSRDCIPVCKIHKNIIGICDGMGYPKGEKNVLVVVCAFAQVSFTAHTVELYRSGYGRSERR